jgi:uncharacterized RDD family membrane protein YckC
MAEYAAQIRLAEEKMRRRLITPEGVDLSLRLASVGQRMGAFALDLLIMLGLLVALTILALIGLFSTGGYGDDLVAVIWLLGFFLIRNFYFIVMEMGPRAATFGKRANGLRVVARSGARLTADAVIARNLLREIEFYLPLSFLGFRMGEGSADGTMTLVGLGWACIFLFFPMFNKDGLRVGDLLAGTWVISAPKRILGAELLGERDETPAYLFTEEQLDAYGVFELQTLERVLRDSNPEAMATVCWTIRQKIGIGEIASDSEFLNTYYAALRARLERKLLFGRRRLDKHDR